MVMSWQTWVPRGSPSADFLYSSGARKRWRFSFGSSALMRAINDAQSGADALVPPPVVHLPLSTMAYQGGPASAATSGTTRPSMLFLLTDLTLTSCHFGRSNLVLTPPPVAPLRRLRFAVRRPGFLCHTRSINRPSPCAIWVPPTASTYGLDAGKAQWARSSVCSSLLPSSPELTQTVMPRATATCSRSLMASTAAGAQSCPSSVAPQ